MDLIQFAKGYLGTREGTNKHKEIVDGYNAIRPLPRGYRVKYTDSWCATFVSYCLHKCGINSVPYECSVYYMYRSAKSANLVSHIPGIGKLVVYDWKNNGSLDHIGIITSIAGDRLQVIEGNYSNSVKIRNIKISSSEIKCYIDTGYVAEDHSSKSLRNDENDDISNDEEPENTMDTIRFGAKGQQVKTIQALLKDKFGYNVKGKPNDVGAVDGDWGENTDRCFKDFQKNSGLIVDGVCGKKSWNALFKN